MVSEVLEWVGTSIAGGRYEIAAKVGEGGMGYVYRAYDANLETDVIIKVPRRSMLEDPDFAERFAREIRSLVRLSHPHIVKVIDVGTQEGIPFAVMQFLSGGSLEGRHVAPGNEHITPVDPHSLGEWLPSIAAALDFIHGQGYVHRDVKPANILFDAHGHAYLSDFGIAKALAAGDAQSKRAASLTGTGMVLGTPHYMAPELVLGQDVDGRVDQYALAVAVHELLTGEMPIDAPSPAAVLVQQATQSPTPLRERAKAFDGPLTKAVLKALSKAPDKRFPTCSAFAEAVVSAVRPLPSGSPIVVAKAPPKPITSRATTPGRVPCPNCQAVLVLKPQHGGRRARCHKCNELLIISNDICELTLANPVADSTQPGSTMPTVGGPQRAARRGKWLAEIDWRLAAAVAGLVFVAVALGLSWAAPMLAVVLFATLARGDLPREAGVQGWKGVSLFAAPVVAAATIEGVLRGPTVLIADTARVLFDTALVVLLISLALRHWAGERHPYLGSRRAQLIAGGLLLAGAVAAYFSQSQMHLVWSVGVRLFGLVVGYALAVMAERALALRESASPRWYVPLAVGCGAALITVAVTIVLCDPAWHGLLHRVGPATHGIAPAVTVILVWRLVVGGALASAVLILAARGKPEGSRHLAANLAIAAAFGLVAAAPLLSSFVRETVWNAYVWPYVNGAVLLAAALVAWRIAQPALPERTRTRNLAFAAAGGAAVILALVAGREFRARKALAVVLPSDDGSRITIGEKITGRQMDSPPRRPSGRRRIEPISPRVAHPGEPVQFQIRVDRYSNLVSDVEFRLDDPIPEGATLDARTGRFVWVPNSSQIASHRFRVSAKTPAETEPFDTTEFVINVYHAGRATLPEPTRTLPSMQKQSPAPSRPPLPPPKPKFLVQDKSVEQWVAEAVAESDPDKRAAVYQRFAEASAPQQSEAVKELIALLDNWDRRRLSLSESLRATPAADASVAGGTASTGPARTALEAAEMLRVIGQPAQEQLISASSRSRRVEAGAAYTLGGSAFPSAAEELGRRASARTGDVGYEATLSLLAIAVRSRTLPPQVWDWVKLQYAPNNSLGSLKEPFLRSVGAVGAPVVEPLLQAIREANETATQPTRRGFGRPTPPPKSEYEMKLVWETFPYLSADGRLDLAARLATDKFDQACLVAKALAATKPDKFDRQLSDKLAEVLEQGNWQAENPKKRREFVEDIAALGGTAVAGLRKIVRKDKDQTSQYAAEALGEMGAGEMGSAADSALYDLTEMLKKGSYGEAAIEPLIKIAGPQKKQELLAALRSGFDNPRFSAAEKRVLLEGAISRVQKWK